MATEIDICNLALSYLGDLANVTSINPPDGTPQSGHCSRFYPIARDALLEMHAWDFSVRRGTVAQVANPSTTWVYAYALPNLTLNVLEVLDPSALDDYETNIPPPTTGSILAPQNPSGVSLYQAQRYVIETASDGSQILLTNQENPVVRYTEYVTDTTRFTPLFVRALARLLAADLAGPLVRGANGRVAAQQQLALANALVAEAAASDSNQRHVPLSAAAPWIVNR